MEIDIGGLSVPRFSRKAIVEFVESAVAAVSRARAAPFRAATASVVFVDDGAMKRLNRRFRGKAKTTDVLTFEGDADSGFLGEIVISLDRARRQAAEESHSLATEIRYLLLHGVIHASGYDHETDNGEMNALETKLRTRVGLD